MDLPHPDRTYMRISLSGPVLLFFVIDCDPTCYLWSRKDLPYIGRMNGLDSLHADA
jgi:hypothetical protein